MFSRFSAEIDVGRNLGAVCFVLFLTMFSLSSVIGWFEVFNWHDEQRIWQLMLLVVAIVLLVSKSCTSLSNQDFFLVYAFFVLGVFSVLHAEWVAWAFKEWARFFGLVSLALLVSVLARRRWMFLIIIYSLSIVGVVHGARFVVYYVSACLSGIGAVDVGLMYNGFVNPRFFGQFQLLLMPVLAGVIASSSLKKVIKGMLFAVLTIHWCLVFSLGGRGVLIGLLLPIFLAFLILRNARLIFFVQISGCVLGWGLFVFLFVLVPMWFDSSVQINEAFRGGLSGREELWLAALLMAENNPFMGVGPMHYAAEYNAVMAAHPHQVVLQILAEWGVPAACLMVYIGCKGLFFWVAKLRCISAGAIAVGIWSSVVGAIFLAQVDGVLVMPYTETWLAILIGLAMAEWSSSQVACGRQRVFWGVFGAVAALVLIEVLFAEVPTLTHDSDEYMAKHGIGWSPRFWLQGWIPNG